MKKIFYYILPLLSAFAFVGCSEQDDLFSGEGNVNLNVNIKNSVTVENTRAELTDEEQNYLKSICRVRLYNGDGVLIRRYEDFNTVPNLLKLNTGSYSVRVTAGDSVAASRTQKFYEGIETFNITRGVTTPVNVNCNILNTLVSITFDESLYDMFNDIEVKVSTSTGELVFTPENADSIGYYMIPEDAEITCLFDGKTLTNTSYTKEDKILEAKKATHYKLTYKYSSSSSSNTGGGALDLDVIEEPIVTNEENIVIYQRPQINAYDAENQEIDMDAPYSIQFNTTTSLSMWASTSCSITEMTLSSDEFAALGITSPIYSLMSEESITYLAEQGIVVTKRNNIDNSVWGVRFSQAFISKVSENEGNYTFKVSITDSKDQTTERGLTIKVTGTGIATVDLDEASVWTNRATLLATVNGNPSSEVSFRYRIAGSSDEWQTVAATANGSNISAEVTGLEANTSYEYQAVDGDDISVIVCTFTTEAKSQPENAGFEGWHKPNKAWLLYAEGDNMWWDSGNHGSSTMNKNVTEPGTDYLHSGTSSAKLSSQFVGISIIGKFAAGNAFVGQYLKTDGTDGILGWGRPFASRPTKLRGYIKYIPGEVKYSKVPDNIDFPIGSTDIGSVFLAVGDWAGEVYDGVTWPVIIKTKTSERQLFDPEGEGVIAFGRQDFTTSTPGEGLVEFEIPLDYYSLDRKPTAIIIVASASKYGDYFSGGNSTMWLDDLELIYE